MEETKTHSKFEDSVASVKQKVFMVARGRQHGAQTDWIPLGTAFLASPNRLLSASHVFEDPNNPDPKTKHLDGDRYLLIYHDDDDQAKIFVALTVLGETLHLYPDEDLAVLYLPDSFYEHQGTKMFEKDDYIKIEKNFVPLGRRVGVIGYPLSSITFRNQDLMQPNVGDVVMRVDQGVVNARYYDSRGISSYNFTIPFNPGNSGGPIFDSETGKAIGVVNGFRVSYFNLNEHELPLGFQPKHYSEKSFLALSMATYSYGTSSKSLAKLLGKHNVSLH